MALPSSGTISMSQVSTELGYGSTSTRSLNDTYVRSLAGVASGAISFTNLHGKNATPSLSKSGDASGSCTRFSIPASCTATTNSVTCTVSNGVSPFTYAWSHISGVAATVNSPTAATTSFSRTSSSNTNTGVYRCTVTGANGFTGSVDVTVYTEHIYEPP